MGCPKRVNFSRKNVELTMGFGKMMIMDDYGIIWDILWFFFSFFMGLTMELWDNTGYFMGRYGKIWENDDRLYGIWQ